ncbi:hypothetical protein P154DRAFT_201183 [Amniculicola lignicola CBS 123094]|uniref:Uncharacterized protein n=1 Tax=Amniculicola lignicola CBS 123094 TaxID=1392246 RepID=A0A6A5WH39_9PLEO|nr:hypothetical protein P154DRAFT_201183 [Amniculicola lignicola CBS 123094]
MAAQESAEAPPKGLPNEDRLKQAADQAQKAIEAQGMANKLRDAASSITDPKKREKMLTDAYNKEIEAHGNSKKARMLSSGAFQGAIGGGGIGGAVSMGVGTVVGTVVGGVTAIPVTGLGALIGSGVGLAHGPFIKLSKMATGKGGEEAGDKIDTKEKNVDSGEIADDDDAVPNPEVLRQAANALAEEREKKGDNESKQQSPGKKRPRKIEIRSQKKEGEKN